ncbi:unnamed protein product [Rhizopus stolonifer]
MSEKHSESIAQFVSMTQSTEAQAQFFLEMIALTQYFESNTAEEAAEVEDPLQREIPAVAPKKTAGSSSSSKIRTFRDLNNDGDEESHSDDDERENLYAGGEKSGMVVQGPNKKGHSLVDNILKKAEEGGQAHEEPTEIKKKPKYYTGAGYRLGSEDEPSSISQTTTAPPPREEREPAVRHLTFWRNGFSVDDGPLFEYADPANQEMLTAINSGRAPLSLLNVQHGQPVEVRVIKRQDDDYTPPPKAPPKPFEGAGNRLGAVASVEPTPVPGTFPTEQPTSTITVDETQPVTSIQIRLGDGSRLIAKLNHTHTIGDIRQHIDANSNSNRPYIIQTTFPVQQLDKNNQTIKEAGLLNSVIVQRYQ